ncbi:spermine synthase [Paenibacillus sp. BR2-3]|uniref:spermine synthase n=1 Tax=Paenibacillus sp. BR2-3 TaxID=3048494 RepID=UPI0039779DD8
MNFRPKLVKDMMIMFIVSFTMIVYEVFLPRLFSVILDYNYVFLVISLATLGLGLGGFLSYYFMHRFDVLKHRIVGIYAISMVTVVYIIYLLSYKGILFYSIIALIPFFLSGWVIAGIMQQHHKEIRLLYFSDLVGAGLGAAGAIFLMNTINPIRTIGLSSLLLFCTYFSLSFRKAGYGMKAVNTVVLLLLVVNLSRPLVDYLEFNAYRTSPNTTFYKEPEAKIVFSQWNAFTRTDVYDADDQELLYITIDGGAVSPISKFTGDLKDVDYLRSTTSFLAFQGTPHGRVLIIGAGGGQEVLTAQMTGYSDIEAVDINRASFHAVHKTAAFSGDIFNKSNVTSIVSDGRNYIRQTNNKYDLIYLSLVTKKSENGVGLALTENFIYTQEAIKEYMLKLTDQGRLTFLLHDEKELNKILFSAKNIMKEQGISEADMKNHIAVVGTYQHLGHVVAGMNDSRITRPLIIIQNKPFSQAEAASLYSLSRQIQQIPVHIPYVKDQFQSLQGMMQSEPVNVAANRDDMPFFYHKTNRIPWSLMIALFITLIISIFMIRRSQLSSGHAIYFSGLAIGFMLIEVTLVQRLILPLGHPTLSFVLVLGVLLVTGGIGSLFSSKRWFLRPRYVPLLLVGMITVGVNFIIGWVDENSYVLSQTDRLLLLGLILVPLGFFMGMPFPFGLSKMRHHQVAISWGLNGIMTVAGSLLAAIISLTYGFTTTMIIGGAIYALLFTIQPLLKMQ